MTAKKPKEQRRKQILDAAMRCFIRKGYHATTIDDITRESDLTKGGIYWHFKSKWNIYLAMVEEHKKENRLLCKMMKEFELDKEILIKGGLLFVEEHIKNEWISRVFNEVEAEAMRNKEVREEYFSIFKEDKEQCLIQFEKAYENNMIRKTDFESITMVIIMLIKGLCTQYWLSDKELDYKRIWNVFCDALLHGLLK